MPDALDALPDAARLWLLATNGDPTPLLADVQAFCAGWTSHGRPVEARAAVLAGRVLAVAARITEADVNAGVSGCGIDAMKHAVEQAALLHGRTLSPALAVSYRDAEGAWQTVPRAAFRGLASAGQVSPATLVLDLTPATLGGLRAAGGVARPAAASWHAAALRLAARATA